VTTPTINVNLKPCDCLLETRRMMDPKLTHNHWDTCAGAPVLVPCPLPNTVTFKVALGECLRGCAPVTLHPGHLYGCPGRPVSVTCCIGGDGTWEGSEVAEVDVTRFETQVPEYELLLAACRARWEIVKALVLGRGRHVEDNAYWPEALFNQRDTVFAALANMARAEEAHEAKRFTLAESLRPRSVYGSQRPSEEGLARYVTSLINTVGALS